MNTSVCKDNNKNNNKNNKKAVVIKTLDVASDISFDDDNIIVSLLNGVKISTPLKYFPRLMNASPEQRNRWRLIGKGIGMHWEDIDEDISIDTLFRYSNQLINDEYSYYPINNKLSTKIRRLAKKRGISADNLINLWLQEKLQENSSKNRISDSIVI